VLCLLIRNNPRGDQAAYRTTFKFRRPVHRCEKAINARHRNILQFLFAALPTLEALRRLQRLRISTPRFLEPAARSVGICVQQMCASQPPYGRGTLTQLPCAQGTEIGSKGSIVFRRILTITTIWGICSSLDSQP
jgi:hypothetical protein